MFLFYSRPSGRRKRRTRCFKTAAYKALGRRDLISHSFCCHTLTVEAGFLWSTTLVMMRDGTADVEYMIWRERRERKRRTYMLVLSNPLCCDKVYESVSCTPTRTSLVLLNRKGFIRQKDIYFNLYFLLIIFASTVNLLQTPNPNKNRIAA